MPLFVALLLAAAIIGSPAVQAAGEAYPYPPEPPLPMPPADLPAAPAGPLVKAPDARDLLTGCTDPSFIACFRDWRPPPPPPEPVQASVSSKPPPPADPKAPRAPAQPGGLSGGVPPPPDPKADQATFDALARAIKDAGLDGKVLLPEPPKDGNAVMKLNQPGASAAPPPTPKKAPARP